MAVLQNRKVALIISIILIVMSIIIGAGHSLNKIRKPISDIFYIGIDSDNISIENDLKNRIGLSANLITIAKKYLDNEDRAILSVSDARDLLQSSETLKQKFEANQKLTSAASDLYGKLVNMNLSEQDINYRESIYSSLTSIDMTIANDAVIYNKKVEDFNTLLKGFPGILANIFGLIRPIEIYGI